MDTAIVVFTRDLRLHDNPALHQACAQARQVVPVFVADPALAAPARSPNRARFLAESLADLRSALRERGADLVIRAGDPAAEVIRLAADVGAHAVYARPGTPISTRWTPGARARPGSRSSTPGCASWPPRASCTTGPG